MSTKDLHYLSQEQLDFFHENGYLHLKNVYSQQALDNFQKAIEKWVNRVINNWVKKGLIDHDYADVPFERRYLEAWRAAKTAPIKFVVTKEIAGLELFNFLVQNPQTGKIAQDLTNAKNVQALEAYMVRPTFPNKDCDFDTLWHQDAQCTPDYGLDENMNFVTLWIPFMDIDEHNSCLQMEAGHHKKGVLHPNANERPPHYSLSTEISDTFTNVTPVPAKRGDLVCIHKLTPHNALPNNSDNIRWSIDMRFEGQDEPELKKPERGFFIRHEDPDKIPKSPQEALENLWQGRN